MTHQHECKCKECKPDYFPEVSPRTPGYTNWTKHHPSTHPTWIDVDGKRQRQVSEAVPGNDGWVKYYTDINGDGRAHRCTCGKGGCAEVKQGHVEFGPPDPTRKTLEERVAEEESQTA